MKKVAKRKSAKTSSIKKSLTKQVSAKGKPFAKVAAKPKKKLKKVSIAELFDMKQQVDLSRDSAQLVHNEQNIPPHELHERAHLQPKPQGNTKLARANGPGSRNK